MLSPCLWCCLALPTGVESTADTCHYPDWAQEASPNASGRSALPSRLCRPGHHVVAPTAESTHTLHNAARVRCGSSDAAQRRRPCRVVCGRQSWRFSAARAPAPACRSRVRAGLVFLRFFTHLQNALRPPCAAFPKVRAALDAPLAPPARLEHRTPRAQAAFGQPKLALRHAFPPLCQHDSSRANGRPSPAGCVHGRREGHPCVVRAGDGCISAVRLGAVVAARAAPRGASGLVRHPWAPSTCAPGRCSRQPDRLRTNPGALDTPAITSTRSAIKRAAVLGRSLGRS